MGEEKEKEFRENQWMVRPCVVYKDEYDDCTSIRARFNQYFIFGQMLDCNQWNTDYRNCYQWRKYNSDEAYNELIKSEKQRRLKRLRAHYANDVWEKREKPPENWNAPLPEWMQKDFQNSYLHIRNEEMKEGKEVSALDSRCTIL
ncbi:synaptic plasticity regulator PANTS [Linepithema humile]|uniref:synaptic plasticity regulator PANTS n=1 Tax=Linepithema humile TaxID=83485 RepID=UPI00062329F4|nr:PREDICTED: UPF0545 protein C22orf39 homolog [Linepithema humile]XP_012235749.1 PREDICTED: UPF0545 protein C22orf39 homolog [Linepithema humile]XP_012235750.1 PREDICTED: UPF0545 protein C22orf39 homolog [Linepithema humile]